MASSSQKGGGARSGEYEPWNLPPALAEKPFGLPTGKYILVGWDMTTSGKRLIDEICHIAAYTPSNSYSQFIMPFGNLRPGARRRNNIRVVTVGRYRMLKCTLTHQVIKTKSGITTLIDFMNWLESVKKDDENVILLYHDPGRMSPTVLINALIQYQLLDRFKSIVSGFMDSYALSAEKCKSSVNDISLRMLAKMLLEEGDNSVKTALHRAKATYKLFHLLANQGGEQLQDIGAGREASKNSSSSAEIMEQALEFTRPISTEIEALNTLKDLLNRQNSFRPVFSALLRGPGSGRKRLIHLRRILTDAGLLYEQMRDAFHDAHRAGLENLMSPLVLTTSEEDLKELVDIFEHHFDQEQVRHYPMKRVSRPPQPVPIEEQDELYLSTDSDNSLPLSPDASFSGLISPHAYLKVFGKEVDSDADEDL